MSEYGEGNDRVVSSGPCPKCGSKDNLKTYEDGHKHCYSVSCGYHTKATGEVEETERETPDDALWVFEPDADGFKPLSLRKLESPTLRRFGYFKANTKSGIVQVSQYYDQGGDLAWQKLRDASKDFPLKKAYSSAPSINECQLFGQPVWGEKFDKRVVITEGEIDAMSVAQATDFKIPVVSLNGGAASAEKCIKANYRWLDRFEEIVLWFDNDEPGQEAIAPVAQLFQVGKVKTVKVDRIKDASELLQAGQDGTILQAIYTAVGWRPQGITNVKDCISDMDVPSGVKIIDYPWPAAQGITRGVREGEVVYHVAGTGIGKTTIITDIGKALLDAGIRFGVMRFEDSRRKAQLDLMGVQTNRRLHLEEADGKVTAQELKEIHMRVFEKGNVEFYDPTKAEHGFKALLGYVRYMAKALECKVIFIDPLSYVASAAGVQDKVSALDAVAHDFEALAKQLNVNLQITHHLKRPEGRSHEEGGEISLAQIRGSGGIAMFADGVFAYRRNQQGSRPDLTQIEILKNRFTGETGSADVLKWDPMVGRNFPTDEEFPEDSDEGGSGTPKFGAPY